MFKKRGGQKQRDKNAEVWEYYRDPLLGAAGKGVRLLERLGWEEGRGLGNGGGRSGEGWGVGGRWVEQKTMVEKEEIIWQWMLTSAEGAHYAHQKTGLPFSQVLFIA